MITLAMATEIDASRDAVWRAVLDPEQERHWRPGVTDRLENGCSIDDALHLRFRIRLHDVPIVLDEHRTQIVQHERLVSELRFGLFRFEETFTLLALAAHRTRLGIRIAAPNRMPLVGASLDRFDVRRFGTDLAAVTLQAVRDWCERGTPPAHQMPSLRKAAGAGA